MGQAFSRFLRGWLGALILTVVLAVIFQTQNVIARLNGIGAEIGFGDRLAMTAQDVLGLSPLYGIFVALALLIAFLAGALVYRLAGFGRPIVFTVAGGVAIFVMLTLMRKAFFDIDMIAGARDQIGVVFQVLAGMIGGFVFARLSRAKAPDTRAA